MINFILKLFRKSYHGEQAHEWYDGMVFTCGHCGRVSDDPVCGCENQEGAP